MWIKSKSERLKAQRAKAFRRAHADPLTRRHWHTGQGAQIDRIDDAQEKRSRRAEKLKSDMNTAFGQNYAHWTEQERSAGNLPKRKHPFYVAK